MHDFIVLINQGLTVFLLVLILYLFGDWWPGFKRAVRDKSKGFKLLASDWIMIAIVVSFFASFSDNVYWLAAWSGRYLHEPWGDWLLENGTVANSVFRQGLGVLAVYLHLFAARVRDEDPQGGPAAHRSLVKPMMVAFAVGAAFTLILWLLR